MPEKVFLNDHLLDFDKASISISDSAFLYGAGLFETMRSCAGVVFALKHHLDRLLFSARNLSIKNPYDKDYLADAIYKVLGANNLTDARIRLTLTAGAISRFDTQTKPNLLITATKFEPYPREFYENGVLVILSPFRQNPTDPIYHHKTTSYFSRITVLNIARKKNAVEALWFTTDNHLAEGCISNVFLVKDSSLYTPPIETPVLAGVARQTVCRIAKQNNIPLIEKPLSIDDLLAADEVFLTNVIMQILPVTHIEKHLVGNGKIGPATRKLQTLFDNFVKTYCSQKK